MPLNDRKIVAIILEQCQRIEERCDGYRDAIVDAISDILEEEYNHRISATNIQKKINNKCNAVARFLTVQRDRDTNAGGLDS